MRGSALRVLVFLAFITLPGCATQLDYTSWEEGLAGLLLDDVLQSEAEIHVIGDSSTPGIQQVAIKISHDADEADNGERNAILFECGMHAREWFAAETCYELIDWLIGSYATATVQELLDQVDVWVIPQTNPAGRLIDDQFFGDPTLYTLVCRGGADEGDACAVDADCADNDCYSSGWRTNGNRADCAAGVDLARNFSSGWDGAAAVCDTSEFMKFRGTDPFSEPESLNLRKFVHNHMISTVVIVHANAQQTWNRWANTSATDDFLVDQLAAVNAAGVTPDTEAAMPRDAVGGGVGQFSAWLTEPSNVAGELDEGTERNISTYFLELPINATEYYADDYNGHDYQYSDNDGSNSFHPSSSVWLELWEESLKPVLTDLIRQTRSPQCAVDANGARITAECEANDFGLVGAKIAKATNEPGKLDYQASSREETLAAGLHEVTFAVQNHGSDPASTSSNAEVRFFENGTLVHSESLAVSLANGDRGLYSVSYDFPALREYLVEIELDSDDFSNDNLKSFAFNTSLALTPSLWQVLLSEWEYRFETGESLRPRVVIEGSFAAPEERVDPEAAPEARLAIFPAWGKTRSFQPLVFEAFAPGERIEGRRATPRPEAGRTLEILEAAIERAGSGRDAPYRLRLVLDGKGLEQIEESRLLGLDLWLGERLQVSGLKGRRPVQARPPNRHRQDDENEAEPN